MKWACPGCGHTVPVEYRWDHDCPAVYRVYSPSRNMAAWVTDDWGHATGRAKALNQQASCDNGPQDWRVETSQPVWRQQGDAA